MTPFSARQRRPGSHRTTRASRILMALAVLLGVLPHRANAQVGGFAKVALTGFTTSQILKQFEGIADRLLATGELRGSALMVQMGNQMRVATANASLAMADQQNTMYQLLGRQQQQFFGELNRVVDVANGSLTRAITVAEIANMNLIELTNLLPATQKRYFYMNQVQGLAQIYHADAAPYLARLQGLGFAQDPDRAKYEFTVLAGTTPLGAAQRIRNPPYDMGLEIPATALEAYFHDDKLGFAPLMVRGRVTSIERCNWVRKCTHVREAEWPLRLTLLPKHPGVLEGNEVLITQQMSPKTDTTSDVYTTPNCSTDDPCDWSRTIPLANNQRAVAVWLGCSGGGCMWCYSPRRGGGGVDYDITDGGTKVTVYRHCDGASATTTHYVEYGTLVPTPVHKPITAVPLAYGKDVTLSLSPANTNCAYRLTVKLVTGQSGYLDNNITQTLDGMFKTVSIGSPALGVACAPIFRLSMP
jgi:hypothetical protein